MELKCLVCSHGLDLCSDNSSIAREGDCVQVHCPDCGWYQYEQAVVAIITNLKKTNDYQATEILIMRQWLKEQVNSKITLDVIFDKIRNQISRCEDKLSMKMGFKKNVIFS